MSHELSATFDNEQGFFVANTAGFRSLKAAVNAALSRKNRKLKKPKYFKTQEEADLASMKRSSATDAIRQRNSELRPSTGFGSQLYPVPHTEKMHSLIKIIKNKKKTGR